MPRWLFWGGVAVIGLFVLLKVRSAFAGTADKTGGLSGFAAYATANPWVPNPNQPPASAPSQNPSSPQGGVGYSAAKYTATAAKFYVDTNIALGKKALSLI